MFADLTVVRLMPNPIISGLFMDQIVFLTSIVLAGISVIGIALTLLAIAMGKIDV